MNKQRKGEGSFSGEIIESFINLEEGGRDGGTEGNQSVTDSRNMSACVCAYVVGRVGRGGGRNHVSKLSGENTRAHTHKKKIPECGAGGQLRDKKLGSAWFVRAWGSTFLRRLPRHLKKREREAGQEQKKSLLWKMEPHP